MKKSYLVLLFSLFMLPFAANANETLSFDIDHVYYKDDYRTFDIDFSQGTSDDTTGDLNLSDTWSSVTGSGSNPSMYFHPGDGNAPHFSLDTTEGRYRVSIPKPLDSMPVLPASDSIDWENAPDYINEGTTIDFRGANASANIETVKLAYNADKTLMKIRFKVTEETDLANIGFRFVFFPIGSRGCYGFNNYLEENYPSGASKYLIVNIDSIATDSATVEIYRIDDDEGKTLLADSSSSFERDGDTMQVSFSIVKDDETVVDLSSEEFLMEGVSYSDPEGTPTKQDTCSPTYLYTRSGGEFTALSGDDFDEQADAHDYAMTARIGNFDAFSSDTSNYFTIGFHNNGNDAPDARVTGKWIQGFYNGVLYANTFVLSAYVNNATGSLEIGDSVSVSDIAPENAVVDLAIESVNDGKKLNFYYRIATDGNESSSVSELDETWTRFDSFTISGDETFYGYPRCKGVIMIGSDAMSYPAEIPTWGNEDNNVELVDTEMENKSGAELETEHRLTDFQPFGPKETVELSCAPGEKVVLRYLVNGSNKNLNKLRLCKLKNGNHLNFKSYVESPDTSTIASGDWWITVHGQDPDDAIEWEGALEEDKRYALYFVVQDNDGEYDLDDTQGVIFDPTVIGAASTADGTAETSTASASSGGGGCFLSIINEGV